MVDCLFKGYGLYSGKTAVSVYMWANKQLPGDISKLSLGLFRLSFDSPVAIESLLFGRVTAWLLCLCCSYFGT